MLHTTVPKQLTDKVESVVKDALDGSFHIKCVFTSISTRKVVVETELVSSIHILQNFVGEVSDFTHVTVKVRPEEYALLYKHSKGLYCKLLFYRALPDIDITTEPILEITGVSVFSNKTNLSKKFPKGLLEPDERHVESIEHHSNLMELDIELYSKFIFNLRKRKLNFILQDASMKDMIVTLAAKFGIRKLSLVEPDNKRVYDNIIIPPMMSILNAFKYLQEKDGYGVYNKGFGYYITDETLFVFPQYECNHSTGRQINVYDIGEGAYLGLFGYSREKGDVLDIISNTGSDNTDVGDVNMENIGNIRLIGHRERYMDDFVDVQPDGSWTIAEGNTSIIGLELDGGVEVDGFHSHFEHNSDNVFRVKSTLEGMEKSVIRIGWRHAMPHSIRPDDRVLYHYMDGEEYRISKGRLMSIGYVIGLAEHTGKRTYTSTATMNILAEDH